MITNEEFKSTEKMLFSYKKLDTLIKQIDIDIKNIEIDYEAYKGFNYSSERTGKTNAVSSEVENFIINKEKQISKLEADKKRLQIYKEKIEVAINNFTSDQKILFNLRYIEGANWLRIISDMHISKDTYYKLRRQLVYSAAESMNPARTLREIEERYRKGYIEE